jgi:L-ectoine synthase
VIVRKLADILGTEREVKGGNWTSRRLLLAGDKMGFSVHDTIIHAGTSTRIHYANHLEAVYLIEGGGKIEDLDTGEVHRLEAGTIYALDRNDRHILSADDHQHMRMVCVFNPPVVGPEVHDENGVYPAMSLEDAE